MRAASRIKRRCSQDELPPFGSQKQSTAPHLLRGESGPCRALGLRSISAAAAVKGGASAAPRCGGDSELAGGRCSSLSAGRRSPAQVHLLRQTCFHALLAERWRPVECWNAALTLAQSPTPS